MKKTCLEKESKIVTTKDVEGILNDSKEENLTEEQLFINEKLSESGIEDEGLGWLEKRNIFKTINVSLNTSGSEKLPRTSPRLAKIGNSKASKWIENSFDNNKKDDVQKFLDNEKPFKIKFNKSNSEINNTLIIKPNLLSENNKGSQELHETNLKLNNKKELQKDAESNSNSSKSTEKVHYIKIQVEKSTKKEVNSSSENSNNEVGNKKSSAGKKRTSLESYTVDTPKKLKMEESNEKIFLEQETPLKIEMEMERKKHNIPFKIRDIKAIVFECEFRNKKWKETFSKYKCPARWGIPIVRNCSEKWDGKQIPSKLLFRYQKYLSSHNLLHPVFFPVKSQNNDELNKMNSEISSQSSAGTISECKDESENDFKDINEESLIEDEFKKSVVENNLNVSTPESSSRMVLRNRNQQKPIMVEEEDNSSDDSDEWFSKQKAVKKQKISSKNKKLVNQNRQLVLKLERCNINKRNGNEESMKNGNESFTAGSLMGNSTMSQMVSNSKPEPDPDTMVCPICSLRFKKQLIENHATECASKTYKD